MYLLFLRLIQGDGKRSPVTFKCTPVCLLVVLSLPPVVGFEGDRVETALLMTLRKASGSRFVYF